MKTYRDILKWGDKREEKLDERVIELLTTELNLTASDLLVGLYSGDAEIRIDKKNHINDLVIQRFINICSANNISFSDDDRASHAYGKHFSELLKLRLKIIDNAPDIIIYPRNTDEVEQIINICREFRIPLIPFGGGSSVTCALQSPNGGVCLDLSKNMNTVIEINKINSSVKVEAGISGPDLEKALNKEGFTCGHFPQSFEFSTVGGWIAARGAGTLSTGYGKIEDITLGYKVVTPKGIIETNDYPADAQALNLKHIFPGSEGVFGVITEATLKIRKYMPENTAFAAFIFKSFEQAVNSMRETMQAGYGKPHLFRLSDPEETDIAFKMKGFNKSIYDKILRIAGYQPGERVLMLTSIEGNAEFTQFVKKSIKRTVRKHGGMFIGEKPVKKWLDQRYSSAYARDPLMDRGIITDTFETSVNWDNLIDLWQSARNYLKSRPKTIVMVHISHVYENGANLYITFLTPWKKNNELDDYSQFLEGLVNIVINNKGSLSHHHGIGRVLSPWLKQIYGENGIGLVKAIKNYLDPDNIMNPVNMLGLD